MVRTDPFDHVVIISNWENVSPASCRFVPAGPLSPPGAVGSRGCAEHTRSRSARSGTAAPPAVAGSGTQTPGVRPLTSREGGAGGSCCFSHQAQKEPFNQDLLRVVWGIIFKRSPFFRIPTLNINTFLIGFSF